MYRTSFNLRHPKSQSETAIFLLVTMAGKRIKISTRQKVLPAIWDFERRTVTRSTNKLERYESRHPGITERASLVRHYLSDLLKEVERFFVERSINGAEPHLSDLKVHLTQFIEPKTKPTFKFDNVLGYLNIFIKEIDSGSRKQANGTRYRTPTVNSYRTLKQTLQRFERDTKITLRWENINRITYSSLIKWHEDQGYSTNYTGRHIKDLKCVLRSAYEDGVHTNHEFSKRYFVVPKDYKKKVPLSHGEVQKLANLDLTDQPNLDFARDIFLLGCHLGLRVSDIKRITPEHINKDTNGRHLTIRTQKTGTDLKIPISRDADRILQKYYYRIPKFWEQVINRRLKIIGPMIGLSKVRAQKLTLHLSRHTFARLAYQMGIPSLFIMKITGHTAERNFLTYINIAPEDAVAEFRKHAYFQ